MGAREGAKRWGGHTSGKEEAPVRAAGPFEPTTRRTPLPHRLLRAHKAQFDQLRAEGHWFCQAGGGDFNLAQCQWERLARCGGLEGGRGIADALRYVRVYVAAELRAKHSFTVLNASHCGLTVVPLCIARLSTLKALVLSHNSLTKLEHVADLPDLNTIGASRFYRLPLGDDRSAHTNFA